MFGLTTILMKPHLTHSGLVLGLISNVLHTPLLLTSLHHRLPISR